MSVTLDVSKLSGLLNFFAFCRAKGGYTTRGEVRAGFREGMWASVAQAACT